ncbi:MAG TPA: acyl-CoA dehydrogenase family protein [Polyangiaceae bacterium]|nr:acyl-CoA dehydrogenase family protein [Polyangiaceae bacterium]
MDRRPGLRIDRLTGASLWALTRLGGSALAARLGLGRPLEKVVYEGVRVGAHAIRAGREAANGAPSGDARRLSSAKTPALFDLAPTEEQALVVDAMRRFADEVLRPAARAADDQASPPEAVLAQGHALGLAALAVPEALGGAAGERSSVTNVLIAEELARGDMGLATALLAPVAVVSAIVAWGTAHQQARLLPAFVGDALYPAALALLEPQPLFDPLRLRAGAARSADGGWALWGEKALVPLASMARTFLVAADVRGLGARLFVVDRDAPGLSIQPEPSMGLRGAALGRLSLKDVRVSDDDVLGGTGTQTDFDFGQLVDRCRIAWGAMAVGAAKAVLDYVIPYCNERVAFGEPISNKQSVAFLIADIAIELEGMRLLVLRAASRSDLGHDVGREAAIARLQCANKGMKIGSDGVQLLGGHGFVKEHPVERWYRDLRAIGVVEGALMA